MLHLALSEKCAESAIDHSDFISRGCGGHYVFHTNQLLRFFCFVKPSGSVNRAILCQVCEREVPVDGAITELDALEGINS